MLTRVDGIWEGLCTVCKAMLCRSGSRHFLQSPCGAVPECRRERHEPSSRYVPALALPCALPRACLPRLSSHRQSKKTLPCPRRPHTGPQNRTRPVPVFTCGCIHNNEIHYLVGLRCPWQSLHRLVGSPSLAPISPPYAYIFSLFWSCVLCYILPSDLFPLYLYHLLIFKTPSPVTSFLPCPRLFPSLILP